MSDKANDKTKGKTKDTTRFHRALYKRTSIPGTPEELRERRVVLDNSLRKKHREQLITAKRFRHLTRREERISTGEQLAINEHDMDIDPYYRLTEEQVEELADDLKSNDKSLRLEAAQYLAKFVLEPSQALIDYISKGDCIETLTHMLTGTDADEKLQAVRTISNIAAGCYYLWIQSVSTVPYMISFLDSDNAELQEAAAGAIGNMAAEDLGDMTTEDDEVRETIRNNGAVQPLVRMLDTDDSRLVQTACFALANLMRGQEGHLNEFLNAGIAERLFRHLKDETADTVTEICWVMTYLTKGSKEFRELIMQTGISSVLVETLRRLSDQGPVVLPVLRTLGNLAGGPDEYIEILLEQDHFLFTVLLLTHSQHRVIKKEALWVLSNITSSQRIEVVQKVVDANAIKYLADILVNPGGFDIRKGAATCLMNIAWHGTKYMEVLPHQELLPGFTDLIQSQDAESMRIGLAYVDMLLTRVPKGNEVIETTPGCMEALGSVNPMPDPELYALANQLVDRFYKDNPGLVPS